MKPGDKVSFILFTDKKEGVVKEVIYNFIRISFIFNGQECEVDIETKYVTKL